MEIRDVIHGAIAIEKHELPIVDSRYFQRLRHIKQLGFAEFSFPAATHNRYVHCLGAMEIATQAFDTIFGGPHARTGHEAPDRIELYRKAPAAHRRFRQVTRLAALLHDIGHGPLSHTTEFAMPEFKALELPDYVASSKGTVKNRQANHEDYTLKIILGSGLTPVLERAAEGFDFTPRHIAAVISESVAIDDDFFCEMIDGQKINFRPLLHQLISSELDADRMDYLRRDSLHAGVSYGQFDFDWILGNLTSYLRDGSCYLSLQHRALYSFEDFLISRYHMFLMVYFHYKTIVFDEMLAQYLGSPSCPYKLPADVEAYCGCDDGHLHSHLIASQDPWARRIIDKTPYRMLVELHSGVPATKTAMIEQQRLLNRIERDLSDQGIHYLKATSTSELSKYFRKPGDPIYVRYDNHYSAPSFIPIEKCTDLFQRYSEKRSITRLYVAPEQYAQCRQNGRAVPLPYEDNLTG